MLRPLAIVCLAAAFGATAALTRTQPPPPAGSQPPAPPGAPARPGGADLQQLGRQLIEGLKATPGCLGTETARTPSGKFVIFAWFENKKAALAWYRSDAHQQAMDRFFPGGVGDGARPLEKIADDSGPIMAIASLKPSDKPLEGTSAPVSQIAIELYAPLPGGIHVNGGFAPEALQVPGRRDITTPAPTGPAPAPPPKPSGDK